MWNRLDQQGESISELARGQAATEANLAALAASVESGFNNINANLARISERENRPINWIGIGSLLFVVIGSLITFVALQVDPVRSESRENDDRIRGILERELVNAETRGRMAAEIESLHEQQRLIDEWGSRRWITSEGETERSR